MNDDFLDANHQPKPDTNKALKAGIAVVSVIAALLVYRLIQSNQIQNNQQEVIESKVMELASTRIKLDSITTQLDLKIAEIQRLGGDISELQKAKTQLEDDKKELLKNTNAEIASIKASFQAKIQNYESLLAVKDKEIQQLRADNQTLSYQNSTLNNENANLKSEKNSLVQKAERISAQKEDAEIRNQVLSEKVSKATALKTEYVRVLGITDKGKEFDDKKMKASKIARLKVAFMLAKNELTEHEKKTIFVRILDPDGATVFDSATGSGSFSFNGKDIAFTTRGDIFYDNHNQYIEIVYNRGIEYRPGRYIVELYAEGFKIGNGDFEVK
ncbi:hypothetical protein [Flectobacillus major]|uniref:hypothetical protein n=1 Tax=Flectobacillus major TaxID=103 RepID=UPI00040BA23B|nr:hypothetical protein [Flectobacillus major]